MRENPVGLSAPDLIAHKGVAHQHHVATPSLAARRAIPARCKHQAWTQLAWT